MTVVLETERLRLRPHGADDLDDLHALTQSETMRRHLSGGAPSREDSWSRLLRMAGCWAMFGYGNFAVIERASGGYVGNCGLFRLVRELGEGFDGFPEAGWIIAEDRCGRGYASEAMLAALGWFERVHGDGRTVCMIVPGNTASERIAAKLGYAAFGLADHKGDAVMRYARQVGREQESD